MRPRCWRFRRAARAEDGHPDDEAKAVIQDIASFEENQETLAWLKLLALGNKQIEAGRTKPAREVLNRLKGKAAAKR